MERMCHNDKQNKMLRPWFLCLKMKSMQGIISQSLEKDKEIASLKADLAKLTPKSPVPAKTKKGFLANIKEAVTSPHRTRTRTLRKAAETPRR